MTTNKPNLDMLIGIVAKDTFLRIKKGERLRQSSAFKRVTKQLRKELWDTEETKLILEAIRPI